MLLAVAQFHISNTSDGRTSGEIYKFLGRVLLLSRATSFPEKSVLTKLHYIYIYIYIYILYVAHPHITTNKFLLKISTFYSINFKYEKGKDELISERHFKC